MAKRGRPEWRPTRQQRSDVGLWIGGGMNEEEIAAALDVSVNTLRKHCAFELMQGRAKTRAKALKLLMESAETGKNVSAQKHLERLTAMSATTQPRHQPTDRVGKKEQAIKDAAAPDTGTEIGELMAKRNNAVH